MSRSRQRMKHETHRLMPVMIVKSLHRGSAAHVQGLGPALDANGTYPQQLGSALASWRGLEGAASVLRTSKREPSFEFFKLDHKNFALRR
jgi:hypothetical protein